GRSVQRRQRQSVPLATVALVGYTNAGKSTLFNRLTGAEVLADSKLFATLDPTVRRITLPSGRRTLLSDTVGFIRNLPTTLVKAFRATLEEVTEAELLLHVVDVSSPEASGHTAHVIKVLGEIGAAETPQILVLNKIDLLPESGLDATLAAQGVAGAADLPGHSRAVGVSALAGRGFEELLALVDRTLSLDPIAHVHFRFPAGEGAALHLLHEHARVTSTRYTNDSCEVEADAPASIQRRLARYLVDRE
ncbi:MAG: GTPase HflX, partial [Bryobacteraceae bacterium]